VYCVSRLRFSDTGGMAEVDEQRACIKFCVRFGKMGSETCKNQTDAQISQIFIFGIKIHMFRTVPLSIIRSFSLYTQQTSMTYTTAVCTVKNV